MFQDAPRYVEGGIDAFARGVIRIASSNAGAPSKSNTPAVTAIVTVTVPNDCNPLDK